MRFLIVALFMVLASPVHPQERGGDDGQGQAATEQQHSESAPWALPVDVIEDQAETDARKAREQRAEQRELNDLAAQQGMDSATQRMVEIAKWQNYATWLGSFLLFGTLLLMIQANRAAVQAANAAEAAVAETIRIGNAQIRAYLELHGESFPHERNLVRGGKAIIGAKNVGSSPAIGLHVRTQTFITSFPIAANFELPNNWAGVGDDIVMPPSRSGSWTFPANIKPVPKGEIAKIANPVSGRRLYAVAEMRYRDLYGNKFVEMFCVGASYSKDGLRTEFANRFNSYQMFEPKKP
ncbi:MAG: hypothetical protein WDZ83_12555 [Rhizobiaceae bacterium]